MESALKARRYNHGVSASNLDLPERLLLRRL